MGLILDTSVVVAVERRGKSPSVSFTEIARAAGNIEVAVSVLTIFELMHGVERARTEEQSRRQLGFVDILCQGLTVFPITVEIARMAGRIEGSLAKKGIAIALDDLLIGATALFLNFGVATLNVKHFAQIPGLVVTVL
jgi:predicted nucleic acid-binding protein